MHVEPWFGCSLPSFMQLTNGCGVVYTANTTAYILHVSHRKPNMTEAMCS